MKNQQKKELKIRLGLIVATMMGFDHPTMSAGNNLSSNDQRHGPEDDDELEEDDEDFDEYDPLEEIPDDDDLEQEDERDSYL